MNRKPLLALTLLLALAAIVVATAAAGSTKPAIPVRDTTGDTPGFTEQGGVTPLQDAKTVEHWSGSYVDPSNGHTYSFTMVGKKPSLNQSSTTPTDIIPVRVVFDANGGFALDGTSKVAAVEASPLFANNDYTTVAGHTSLDGNGHQITDWTPAQLTPQSGQLEDVTMRSQFNKVGTGYHVLLGQPSVHPTVTLKVPQGKGSAFVSGRGIIYGLVDSQWFSTQMMNIMGSNQIDSTHLPIVLTDNVMLFDAKTGGNCCTIGYHGAAIPIGVGAGSTNGNGKQQVQTFIFSAYSTPGLFGGTDYIADIHALSHEVAEWGDDPFVNNWVNPWVTPTAPQYGCTPILETGDPVVGIGFNIGTNSFADDLLINGGANTWHDGTWHPEDEVLLPWFSREAPNLTSEPTQSPSTNIGRYTLMGDLNPYPGFREPATGC
ncbi:MAG TPA: hypothetical protein VFJ78_02340 [Gaiellaceae bacterium]|nr:hypothetical protein [Gaiellaceae bacterium]